MREIGAEHLAKRQQLVDDLLAGLGRQPRALDKVVAENLAALHVRASYLESLGRDATEVRKQITACLRATSKVEPETAA
jgi:hypothetical protein